MDMPATLRRTVQVPPRHSARSSIDNHTKHGHGIVLVVNAIIVALDCAQDPTPGQRRLLEKHEHRCLCKNFPSLPLLTVDEHVERRSIILFRFPRAGVLESPSQIVVRPNVQPSLQHRRKRVHLKLAAARVTRSSHVLCPIQRGRPVTLHLQLRCLGKTRNTDKMCREPLVVANVRCEGRTHARS
jgi:hypothetical protein